MEGHHQCSEIQAAVARYLLISSSTSNYLTHFWSVDFHVSGCFRKHGNQHPQKQVIDAIRNPRKAGAFGLDLWVSSYAISAEAWESGAEESVAGHHCSGVPDRPRPHEAGAVSGGLSHTVCHWGWSLEVNIFRYRGVPLTESCCI